MHFVMHFSIRVKKQKPGNLVFISVSGLFSSRGERIELPKKCRFSFKIKAFRQSELDSL